VYALIVRAAATAALLVLAGIGGAQAQWTPSKPVRLVVPYAAGGGADIIARRLADKVKPALGQPVLVENRPGAGTALAAGQIARAPADGHTILLATSTTLCVNPILMKDIQYRQEDFAPISVLQSLPFMVVTSPEMGVKSLREFIARAKASPGKFNFGTLGVGSSNHVLGSMLGSSAGIDIVPVHFTSGAPALLSLKQGEIHVYLDGISTSVPRAKSGELKGLAVTSRDRVKAVPEIPTVAEEGVPDLTVAIWYGLVAPAGTPPDAIARLNAEFNKAVADPEITASLIADGTEPLLVSPAQFATLIREDTALWRRMIEPLKIELK
jgi:tripartite-type tricarboxylate transporter receptor subunit TctC